MKSSPPLPRNKQVDAISWAASKAGTSYGKYMLTLTDKEKQRIYCNSPRAGTIVCVRFVSNQLLCITNRMS